MAKVGGTGAVQAADAKIQELADKVLAASVAAHSIPSLTSLTLPSPYTLVHRCVPPWRRRVVRSSRSTRQRHSAPRW